MLLYILFFLHKLLHWTGILLLIAHLCYPHSHDPCILLKYSCKKWSFSFKQWHATNSVCWLFKQSSCGKAACTVAVIIYKATKQYPPKQLWSLPEMLTHNSPDIAKFPSTVCAYRRKRFIPVPVTEHNRRNWELVYHIVADRKLFNSEYPRVSKTTCIVKVMSKLNFEASSNF